MNKLLQTILLCLLVGAFSQTLLAQAGGTKPELNMYRYNSTQGAGNPQPVLLGDTVGTLQYKGLTGPGKVVVGASIRSFVTGPVSPGVMPSNLVFRTGAPVQQNRMVITEPGLVGIGTMTPQFNLHTVGNTHTTGDFFGRIHMDANPGIGAAPNTYLEEAYFESKASADMTPTTGLNNLSSGGGLLTLAPSNNGAGPLNTDHQLFFNAGGIFHRKEAANNGSWTAPWEKILTSGDINGRPNLVARFLPPDNPSSKLGDGQVFDNGTNVVIGGMPAAPALPAPVFNAADVLTVNGRARVDGNTHLNGNLGLGIAPTANRLEVLGNSRLDGTATVTGLATANSLSVTTNGTVTGNLGIGKASTAFDLDVAGESNFDGRVKIGAANFPSSADFELSVGGSIIAEEMLVQLQGAWPDYVFENGYTAPDLCAWEEFILKNKHLPGIPSAKEVAAKGGVDLGETQRLLLEKIEQLTLIVIEQQKQIDALKK